MSKEHRSARDEFNKNRAYKQTKHFSKTEKQAPAFNKAGSENKRFKPKDDGKFNEDRTNRKIFTRPRSDKPVGDRKNFKSRDGDRFNKKHSENIRFEKDNFKKNYNNSDIEQDDKTIRIAKYLARCGISSRREAETIILAGRVTINGSIVDNLATKVTGLERVCLDNQVIATPQQTRLWLYHKPAGFVTTTRDPEGRPTVFSNLPSDLPRLISVGRLDINTEGLLLFTNDGDLSRVLELPSTGWLRRYRVRAFGAIEQKQLDSLKNGIVVDGIFYGTILANIEKQQGSNVWISLALREGKNREIKKVLGALGLEVNRLIRVSFGPFQLGELKKGEISEVKSSHLRMQLGERLMSELRGNAHLNIPKEKNLMDDTEVERKDTRRGDLKNRSANVWRAKGCCKLPKPKVDIDKLNEGNKVFRTKNQNNKRPI